MNVKLKEITTSLNDFEIFSIFKDDKDIIFLDSASKIEGLSEYSFIGINPFLKFKYENNICYINEEKITASDVFTVLSELIDKYKIENNTTLPYIAGAMGFFSYEFGKKEQQVDSCCKKDFYIPDCYLNFYDNAIIIDKFNKKSFISSMGILDDYENSIKLIENRIYSGKRHKEYKVQCRNNKPSFSSNFDELEYSNCIEKIKDYISLGHVYVLNFTQRLKCKTNKIPYNIYRDLRYINPSPFSAYMNINDIFIMCSSPERFLKVSNNRIETRPIKGTRPRSDNIIEDNKNKKDLINSEKDKSELLMIIDLERNDLSKVSELNSVKVTDLYRIEKYSTVYHLVSTIESKLKQSKTSIDCLKACFPGGSITGAPKKRAMEIIEELEGLQRGLYTGSIGYLGFDGNLDLNIVIRTILLKNGIAHLGVGGGITYESNNKDEYQETLDKAKALLEALL